MPSEIDRITVVDQNAGINITINDENGQIGTVNVAPEISVVITPDGEANFVRTLGNGISLYKTKTGVTFFFKSINGGNGIQLIDSDDRITISADFSALTTDDVAEGTNLYYTKARVDSDIDEALVPVNTTLSSLQNQIDSDGADIATLNTVTTSLQNQIDSDGIAIQTLKNRVRDHDSDIGVLQVEDVNLQNQIDSLQNQIDSDGVDIQTLKTTTVSLQNQIDSDGTAIQAAKNRLDGHDSDITVLQATDVNLQAQINSDGTAIAALDIRLDQAESDLILLNTLLNNLESDLINITTDEVTEGTTNKYYTKTRVDSDIDLRVNKTFVDGLGVNAATLGGDSWGYFTDWRSIRLPGQTFKVIDEFDSDPNLDEALISIDDALLSARSTGIQYGAILRRLSDTTFAVTQGEGTILNASNRENPTFKRILIDSANGYVINDLTNLLTYVFADSNGDIFQQTTVPTREQRKVNLYLGRIAVRDSAITTTVSDADEIYYAANHTYDLMDALGNFKLNGLITQANTDLSFDISEGQIFQKSFNLVNNPLDAHVTTFTEKAPVTFRYISRDGIVDSTDRTQLDPTQYDNGGTLTTIGGSPNTSQIFVVFATPNQNVRVLRGQTTYASLQDAFDAVPQYQPVIDADILRAGLIVAYICVTRTATNLSNTSQARIVIAGRFGLGVSGGATGAVTSVNGQTGTVTLTTDEITEGSNLYFTNERVDDRVATLLQAGSNITLTYDDSSGTLTIASTATGGGGGIDSAQVSALIDSALVPVNTTLSSLQNQIDSDGADIAALNVFTASLQNQIDSDGTAIQLLKNRVSVVESDLTNLTTTDVAEGTNLYYTKLRVDSDIDSRVNKAFVDALGINADQLDGQDGTYYLDYNNFTNTPAVAQPVTVSDSAPASPGNGDLWFNSTNGVLYVRYEDGTSNQWVEVTGGGGTETTTPTSDTLKYVKTANETRVASTAYTTDQDIVTATLEANTIYRFEMVLSMSGNTTEDLRFRMSRVGLSDATLNYGIANSSVVTPLTWNTNVNNNLAGTATRIASYFGYVQTGSDPGTMELQWGQQVSGTPTAVTTMKAGTHLVLTKLT